MSDTRTVVVMQEASSPAIPEGPGALLAAIVQLAKDPAIDVAKLSALMQMQERMEAREAERRFTDALMRLPPIHVKKNGTIDLTTKEDRAANRPGRSVPFARWEDMAAIIEPLLEAEGFRLSFDSVSRVGEGGGLVVTGTLLHRDGHSRSASMPLALDTGPGRNNLQAMGSTLSYGKRYTTEMLLNIVRDRDDDDGARGGARYITEEQAAELRRLSQEAGRQEGPLLDRLFTGAVRSFEELEVGGAYLATKSTLEGIIAQRAKKGAVDANH